MGMDREGERLDTSALECGFTLFVPAKIQFVLLYCLEERFAFVRGSAGESVQDYKASIQLLDFLDTRKF